MSPTASRARGESGGSAALLEDLLYMRGDRVVVRVNGLGATLKGERARQIAMRLYGPRPAYLPWLPR